MTDIEIFAERLRSAMEARHISVGELAELSGLNAATVYRYLTAKFKGAKYTTLKAMASVLNVSFEYLIGASNSMETVQEAHAPSIDITDDEKVLLDLFRNIPAERQQEAIEHLAVYAIRLALKRDQ